MQEIDVDMVVTVRLTIRNPNIVDRCVNDEDGWRTVMYYGLDTPQKVYEHLAYNAIVNGCDSLRGLDGWADLPEDDLEMSIVDVALYD